jgi:hypothetical protein
MDNDDIPPASLPPSRPSLAYMWAWSFAIWLAVWGLFSFQSYVWYQSKGEALPPGRIAAALLPSSDRSM